MAISSHWGSEERKASSSNKNAKKSKGISKENSNKKDKDLRDTQSMQRVIKQQTNEIIDLKKNKGEGKKPFNPFLKKKTNTDSTLKSLLLWALIWKIMLWKIIVVHIMQTIQKDHALNCNASPTGASQEGD